MTDLLNIEIYHAVLVRAEPEIVYDALTTSDGLDSWFTTGAEIDFRPDDHIHFRWADWGPDKFSGEDGGPIIVAERPHKFVFQWHPFSDKFPTTVNITLEQSRDGTVVTLKETGYQDTPSGRVAFVSCATGWGEALTLLKFFVEHGVRY
jgi:uncharacterized protein YndB with AHSA1/START domain